MSYLLEAVKLRPFRLVTRRGPVAHRIKHNVTRSSPDGNMFVERSNPSVPIPHPATHTGDPLVSYATRLAVVTAAIGIGNKEAGFGADGCG